MFVWFSAGALQWDPGRLCDGGRGGDSLRARTGVCVGALSEGGEWPVGAQGGGTGSC